ncbi:MAG: flagellar motor switch protein FliM [Candidatus Tokpelaia sp. JSC189]|nr:MAG: flagellar motor switch protein FliM [Candidatus Tokpelaia sp. JSC189]
MQQKRHKIMSDQKLNSQTTNKKQDVLAAHILHDAGLSSDDLMAFQPIFRDAAVNLSSRLKLYSSESLWSDVRALETLQPFDIATLFNTDSLIVVLKAKSWGGEVLLVLDSNLISFLTEAFFGNATPKPTNRNGRPFSPVEIKVGEKLAICLVGAMNDIFGITQTNLFELKNITLVQQFDADDFAHSQMFSCMLKIGHNKTETDLRILMPRSCHRPIQEAITHMLRAPSNSTDPLWARRLRQEISRTNVNIEAYIVQGTMTLQELSHFTIGQILPLSTNAPNQVKLRSRQKPLYKCSLGKTGSNFSVRVSDVVDEEKEMIDGLVYN